ncbi:glycine rich domain-containing protein [Segatella albensis]|uniref:glycine rich domain-containing protein n=1 Tax=Segatella albensis TaxID=77768 RepID=UPI0004846DE9|nr:glycine rich domain-containing protein [Segatella albensis]
MQTFTAPVSGNYKLEVWGASGGNSPVGGTAVPGKGGYSKGKISLPINKKLYLYVGGKGMNNNTDAPNAGGWNGGGYGNFHNSSGRSASGGGGASDIRIIQHTENDGWSGTNSLRSRIIVAAGGGGCSSLGSGMNGGKGGGLVGEDSPYSEDFSADNQKATGATQIHGGNYPVYVAGYPEIMSGEIIVSGTFGYANIPGYVFYWGGGGGGGWYGGAVGFGRGGSGGSSFVSGMVGCVAMSQDGTQDPNINYQTIDGIEYKFTSATTIDGGSTMPSPIGGTETGHSGNGYCIITWQQLP